MDRVYFRGLTVEDMKVNTSTIKSMDSEYTHGPTADNTLDNGKTVNNTDKVFTKI